MLTWRLQRQQGELGGLALKKRGREAKDVKEVNPLARRITELERDKRRLERRLRRAELLLDKKADRDGRESLIATAGNR